MARPTIAELRALIRSLRYALSNHAVNELDNDNLTNVDLEEIILTGAIVARQRDRTTREVKCVITVYCID